MRTGYAIVENDSGEVSVMSEVDVSEELPNGDDSAFSAEEQHEEHAVSNEHNQHAVVVSVAGQDVINTHESHGIVSAHLPTGVSPDQVYVATPQGYLTADQLQTEGIKTTHIVIHDQTLDQLAVVGAGDPSLKTPTTPLPPPTPSTPLSREKGFRYTWDDSAFNPVLPIRCKSSNGELHKARFGSGGRGRCIRMGDKWFTPSEYEAFCGRASSKDWKRSIRYGGRTLQCLIEDSILHPHATSCTCAACCDDESVVLTGPVRLFIPYKRRKKDSCTGPEIVLRKKSLTQPGSANSSPSKDTITPVTVVSLNNGSLMQPLRVATSESGETIQIISTDASGNLTVGGETAVVMPIQAAPPPVSPPRAPSSSQQPPPSPPLSIPALDVHEQKAWWQLEEMANSLIQQAQQLKALVEQTKQQSIASKEVLVQQLKAQTDREKNEALHALRIEAQMTLNRAVLEERGQKDIAVQQALAQARNEMKPEKMDTVTVVSSDDKVTYVTWAPPPQSKYQSTIGSIMDGEGEESDKEKD